jgi:hypothetical protein
MTDINSNEDTLPSSAKANSATEPVSEEREYISPSISAGDQGAEPSQQAVSIQAPLQTEPEIEVQAPLEPVMNQH